MTTLAIKDGVVAADTLILMNDTILQEPVDKVFKLSNGNLIGCAGNYVDLLLFFDYLEGVTDEKSLEGVQERSSLIYVDKEGISLYDSGHLIPVGKVGAYGSGSQFAYSALLMGASPREAVEVACKLDPYSGGEIREWSVG